MGITIYSVSTGSYDAYSVVGMYTDKELAEQHYEAVKTVYGDDCDLIEEETLHELHIPIWQCTYSLDQKVRTFSTYSREEMWYYTTHEVGPARLPGTADYDERYPARRHVTAYASTEAEAVLLAAHAAALILSEKG